MQRKKISMRLLKKIGGNEVDLIVKQNMLIRRTRLKMEIVVR
jgi:hypothetical protein